MPIDTNFKRFAKTLKKTLTTDPKCKELVSKIQKTILYNVKYPILEKYPRPWKVDKNNYDEWIEDKNGKIVCLSSTTLSIIVKRETEILQCICDIINEKTN
jgi:hypothetical protein